ncbi:MAG: helix-turn-helix domain-containing protein [Verrucomicrobiae bacterium]|nr:helix-turn-helix domain-containing protein [Verrucomicrobiae bacterium]
MKNDAKTGQNPPPETDMDTGRTEALAYDIKQAAAKLNVSTKTIRRLLRRGKLTCCKVLRKILIPREQIENFLKLTCDEPNLG